MSDDAVAVLGDFEGAWLGAKLTDGASGLCNPAYNYHFPVNTVAIVTCIVIVAVTVVITVDERC